MAERHSFPQQADADYSANFGQLIGHENQTSYIETGMGVSLSPSVPEATVNSGLAYVRVGTETISATGEDRFAVGYAVQIPQETVSLTDNDVNYVYLEPNTGTNDNGQVQAYTSTTASGSNALLLAEVDTTNDTVTEHNREPEHTVNTLEALQDISLPNDVPVTFGNNDEFQVEYDSATSELEATDADGSQIYSVGQDGPFDFGAFDITVDGTTLWDESASYIPQSRLQNDSVTINANDGLKSGGSVALGSSVGLDVEPSDFAGAGLSDDGSDNLAINAGDNLSISSDTLNVTDSLSTITSLSSQTSLSIDVDSDNNSASESLTVTQDAGASTILSAAEGGVVRAPTGKIETDSLLVHSNNLTESVTIPADHSAVVGETLSGSGSVSGSGSLYVVDDMLNAVRTPMQQPLKLGGYPVEADGSMRFDIDTDNDSSSEQFRITRDNGSSDLFRVNESGNIDVPGGDITDGANVIYDQSRSWIPQARLENDSITINANDGLKSGGSVALGSSVGLDVEPSDFAGTYLSDDGSDNLTVNLGSGVENDGSGNIRVDEDYSFTFSSTITFNSGISLSGTTITDVGGTTDASSGAIRLANTATIAWRDSIDAGDFSFGLNSNNNLAYENPSGTTLVQVTNSPNFLHLPNASLDIGTGGDIKYDATTAIGFDTSQNVSIPNGNVVVSGNSVTEVGGTTDASSGVIRLANNTTINARNSGDSGDFGITFTTNDAVGIDAPINMSTSRAIQDAGTDAITFDGSANISLGGNLSTSGNNISLGNGNINFSSSYFLTYLDSASTIQIENSGGFPLTRWSDDGRVTLGGENPSLLLEQLGLIPSLLAGEGGFYLPDGSGGSAGDDGDIVARSDNSAGDGQKEAVLFDYSTGSISSERYKKDIQKFDVTTEDFLDIEAVTYTSRDNNEKTSHGFLAEDLYEWNENAVITSSLDEEWAHSEYTESYGFEVGDEVPTQPRKWPVISAHHEILREQRDKINSLEERVSELEEIV